MLAVINRNLQPDQPIWPMLFGWGVIIVLFVAGYLAFRVKRDRRLAFLQSNARAVPRGHVRLIFYKYSGFLIIVRQTTINVVLPVDDAQAMLRQLVWHNLTWGLLAYGGPLVPVFTFFNYRAEKKKIDAARR